MSTQTLTSNAQELCDAVLADLEANVIFPDPYRTALYLRPGNVTPEQCPLLAVFVTADVPQLLATGNCYRRAWRLGIQWWEDASSVIESGGFDPQQFRAQRLLAVTDAILARIEAWPNLAVPGISDRYGRLDGEVSYDDLEQAFCWRSEITVGVNLET